MAAEGVAMLTREERFYEIAAREVVESQLSQAIWGKAFSLTVGDEQKAKALYMKLRVEHLEREYFGSVGDQLRVIRAEVEGGRPFLCPYCEVRTTAHYVERSFVQGPERYRYFCRSCETELCLYGEPVRAAPTGHAIGEKRNNPMAVAGFVLGLASVVLYAIGIVPLLAVVFSGVGLGSFKPESQKNKWMAAVGLALGSVC